MAETLSPEVESLIQRHLDGQEFRSRNDVLLAAMRVFEQYQSYQRLRSDLREGFDQIDRGDAIELEDDSALQAFFEDIKTRGRQRLEAGQAS